MNSRYMQEDYERSARRFYETAVQEPNFLPNIGLDKSLLMFYKLDSNAALRAYSNDLLKQVPSNTSRSLSNLTPLTKVPHAVGLGALVISMILELSILGNAQEDSDTLLQRVFGEEKASSVRDTVTEYLKCHETFMNDSKRLREEIHRLEKLLSNHLIVLRDSLLRSGKMCDSGLKIWVNGAAFHLQMLIHGARLSIHAGKHEAKQVGDIKAATDLYLSDLQSLLEKYKTHNSSIEIFTIVQSSRRSCPCSVISNGDQQVVNRLWQRGDPLHGPELTRAFMNHLVSNYAPIKHLRHYFLYISENLNSLLNQDDSFTLTMRS